MPPKQEPTARQILIEYDELVIRAMAKGLSKEDAETNARIYQKGKYGQVSSENNYTAGLSEGN